MGASLPRFSNVPAPRPLAKTTQPSVSVAPEAMGGLLPGPGHKGLPGPPYASAYIRMPSIHVRTCPCALQQGSGGLRKGPEGRPAENVEKQVFSKMLGIASLGSPAPKGTLGTSGEPFWGHFGAGGLAPMGSDPWAPWPPIFLLWNRMFLFSQCGMGSVNGRSRLISYQKRLD